MRKRRLAIRFYSVVSTFMKQAFFISQPASHLLLDGFIRLHGWKNFIVSCLKVKRVHIESVCFRLFAAVKAYLFCRSSLAPFLSMSARSQASPFQNTLGVEDRSIKFIALRFRLCECALCTHRIFRIFFYGMLFRCMKPFEGLPTNETQKPSIKSPALERLSEVGIARQKNRNLFRKFNPKTIKWARTFSASLLCSHWHQQWLYEQHHRE